MTPEQSVNQEIALAFSAYRFCVLPMPREMKRLTVSPWRMADPSFHAGIVWRGNTGAAKLGRSFVRFGIPGEADWRGFLFGLGRYIQLEAKSKDGRLSPHQIANRDLCLKTGVLWGVARSYDEACKVFEFWGLKK